MGVDGSCVDGVDISGSCAGVSGSCVGTGGVVCELCLYGWELCGWGVKCVGGCELCGCGW